MSALLQVVPVQVSDEGLGVSLYLEERSALCELDLDCVDVQVLHNLALHALVYELYYGLVGAPLVASHEDTLSVDCSTCLDVGYFAAVGGRHRLVRHELVRQRVEYVHGQLGMIVVKRYYVSTEQLGPLTICHCSSQRRRPGSGLETWGRSSNPRPHCTTLWLYWCLPSSGSSQNRFLLKSCNRVPSL